MSVPTELAPWSRLLRRGLRGRALKFVHGMRHIVAADIACPFHSHPEVEIVYHPLGQGITRLGHGGKHAFEQGHVVVYAQNEVHDQAMEKRGEDYCVKIRIPSGRGKLAPPRHGFRVGPLHDPALIEEITSLSGARVGLAGADKALLHFRATAVLLSLIRLAEIEQQDLSAAANRPGPGRYVARAEQYIRDNFARIDSLKEVARHAGISSSHLRAGFKAGRSKSLVAFLNETRIAHAQKLLVHSSLPLKQVARMCGFRDEYYFSSVFRRVAGTPPGLYRQIR